MWVSLAMAVIGLVNQQPLRQSKDATSPLVTLGYVIRTTMPASLNFAQYGVRGSVGDEHVCFCPYSSTPFELIPFQAQDDARPDTTHGQHPYRLVRSLACTGYLMRSCSHHPRPS